MNFILAMVCLALSLYILLIQVMWYKREKNMPPQPRRKVRMYVKQSSICDPHIYCLHGCSCRSGNESSYTLEKTVYLYEVLLDEANYCLKQDLITQALTQYGFSQISTSPLVYESTRQLFDFTSEQGNNNTTNFIKQLRKIFPKCEVNRKGDACYKIEKPEMTSLG